VLERFVFLNEENCPRYMTPSDTPKARTELTELPLLILLAAVQFTHIMDFMVMMPLGPQLMRIFDISPAQFSLLVAAYTFSAGIAGLAGAVFVDRFDRKHALLFCYGGFLLGTLACALAPGYHSLLLARVISGAFGGVSGSMVMTIVGDVIAPHRRAGAMGVIMGSYSMASVAGVPVGLYLASIYSWHAPFLIIVGIGVFIWAFCSYLLPSLRGHVLDRSSDRPHMLAGVWTLLSTRNTQLALTFMVCMVLGHFMIIPFISPSLVANVGLPEQHLSWFYLAGGLASLVSSPIIGKLADRYGKLRFYIITIMGAIVPVYMITHQGPEPLGILLGVAVLFFVFGGGRFIPGQAIVTSAVPASMRGSFMSLNSSVRDLAAGVASLVGGQIVAKDIVTGRLLHYPTLGWIAIVASLISVVIATRVKPVA